MNNNEKFCQYQTVRENSHERGQQARTELKTIKARAGIPAVRKSVPCKNSPSCFTCPLKDCVADSSTIARTNLLPGDMERRG